MNINMKWIKGNGLVIVLLIIFSTAFAQEPPIYNIYNVPLNSTEPTGYGGSVTLVGKVDFKAQNRCMGRSIAFAVKKVTIEKAIINGKTYSGNAIPGFFFPITLTNGKGNLYIKGKIRDGVNIDQGSISWTLQGFLDSRPISNSDRNIYEMDCKAWENHIIRNYGSNLLYHGLQIYKTDVLQRGNSGQSLAAELFLALKKKTELEEKKEQQQNALEKLSEQLDAAKSKEEAERIAKALNDTSWLEELDSRAMQIKQKAQGKIRELEIKATNEEKEKEKQRNILENLSEQLNVASSKEEVERIVIEIDSKSWMEELDFQTNQLKQKAQAKVEELVAQSAKEEKEKEVEKASERKAKEQAKDKTEEDTKEEDLREDVYSSEETTSRKSSCEYLEEARQKLREADYQGQVDLWKKEIARLEPLCQTETNRASSLTTLERSSSASQRNVEKYHQRVAQQNQQNLQNATELGAQSTMILVMLGHVIYGDMGIVKPGNIYSGGNLYNGLEFGFTSTATEIPFNSVKTTMDYLGNMVTIKSREDALIFNINLNLKYKLGYEMDYAGGYVFIGGEAGFSPIFDSFNYNYGYGGRLFFGSRNLRLFTEYTMGKKVFMANGGLDSEESGEGKRDIDYKNLKYGLTISWYGGLRNPARNHINIGLIEFPEHGELADRGEQWSPLKDFDLVGYMFEWKHDHHGILTAEVFPKYYPSNRSKDSFFVNLGYVRSFDWWKKR